jgi:hypothetical protein
MPVLAHGSDAGCLLCLSCEYAMST